MKNTINFRALFGTSQPCLVFVCLVWQCCTPADLTAKVTRAERLPRFTEVREAAALFFVKKHVPEMSPFLAELKRTSLPRYQKEIRYIFQVTELLADIRDHRRHDLELKIWIAQNKAQVLAAKLAAQNSGSRDSLMQQLTKVAKDMVKLDMQVLELKQRDLAKKLKTVKAQLERVRQNPRFFIQQKIDRLLKPVPTQSKSTDS